MLSRIGPPLAILLLVGPILFGMLGTLLPAIGYLPTLGGDTLSLEPFRHLFSQPGIMASATMSLISGVVTAGVSLTIVMIFTSSWSGTPAFRRLQHLVSPLLSVPHAAAAFGLAFLIAPSGMIARMVSPGLTGWDRPPDLLIVNDANGLAMMAGLIIKEIPFLMLITLAALPQADLVRSRALTASLGYGRVAGFLFGSWPAIYRQIRLGVFAVIVFATSVVDVAAILGPTTPPPLAVRLMAWMNDPDLSMRFLASAGAVLQLLVSALALVVWIGIERIGAFTSRRLARAGTRLRHDGVLRHVSFAAMAGSALVVFGGLATLALWSAAGLWQFPNALPESFTARSWVLAAPRVVDPLLTTLIAAILSTLLAALIVLLCLMRENETGNNGGRRALLLIYLPLLIPQAAFLFGLQLLFSLTGTVATLPALVLTHLVFVLPYVFLSLSDPWRAFDRRYEAISAGLGKARLENLVRIRLPMLARAIMTACAVGFAVSVGQYLPTMLIGAGRLPTITTEAVALASGGNRRIIGVYAFLQMALPALGFLVATFVPALIFRNRRALRS